MNLMLQSHDTALQGYTRNGAATVSRGHNCGHDHVSGTRRQSDINSIHEINAQEIDTEINTQVSNADVFTAFTAMGRSASGTISTGATLIMTDRLRSKIVATALVCLAFGGWGVIARAQDASEWDAQNHTAARLIAGAKLAGSEANVLRAGIEIKLDPGWHTYWRDPGDSGVPPKIDFAGSDNVKSVTVLWPAPERFPDGAGGASIGYLDRVILPLHVTPQNAGKPSSLQLKLGYDICYNMCVPVESELKLSLNGDGAEEATIEKAEIRVPRRTALGAGDLKTGATKDLGARSLAIVSVHREPGSPHDRVVVEVAAPAGAAVDLFAEGPTSDWSLPLPEAKGSDTGPTRQFTFELDGLPPDAKAQGATLTLTAVSDDDAVEVPARLD
jgi:DsbC/DsbD-like thiol-disulfide interchange protein